MTVEIETVSLPVPSTFLDSDQCQALLNAYVAQKVGSLLPDVELGDLDEKARRTLAEASEARDDLAEVQAEAQSELTGETEADFADARKTREAARNRVEFLSARAKQLAAVAVAAANSLEQVWTQHRLAWEAKHEACRLEIQALVASESTRLRNLRAVLRLMPAARPGHSQLRLCPLAPSGFAARDLLEEVTNHGET